MAIQEFDLESAKALREASSAFTEQLFKEMKEGADALVEVAKKSGSENLIKNATEHAAATEVMIKALESLVESVERYVAQEEKLDNAMNN